jgi:exoribonuclease R
MHRVFGILYLDDKRTDIDKKGNHLKKFKSFQNNDEYIIKTKKKEMNRIYAIINILDNSVNEYIEHDILDNKLFSKMGTCNWSMKMNNILKQNIKNYMIDLTPNRIDYDANIISVDPQNCIDIDDAISCKIYENNIEIGIHIADPSSYISFNSDLGKELYNRIESLYIYNDVQHMIPECLSIEYISLLEQKKSRAYSCIININCKNINQISEYIQNKNYTYRFIKTNINVHKNLSYDEFEKCILKNEYYKVLYDIGRQILLGLNLSEYEYDTHKMIEAYMLLCNYFAANSGLTQIKRVNTTKKINVNISDKRLQELYNNCLQNSAQYIISDNIQDIHSGLNLVYTHFTSPMRRYIDYLNHIIMYEKEQINQQYINKQYINKINDVHKYYKKIYNLQSINNLIDNKLIDNKLYYECIGKIIFIDDNMLRVLINNKNMINITIFNKKILDNKIIILKEKNEKNIIFMYQNIEIEFELFQDINIKIYKIKYEINPFKIIINDIVNLFN